METQLKKHSLVNLYQIILLIGLTFSYSCKNKAEVYLLQQTYIRLNQQNEYLRNEIESQYNKWNKLMQDKAISNRHERMRDDVENLFKNTKLFLDNLSLAKKTGKVIDAKNLFKYYTSLQKSFQLVKNHVDSNADYPKTNINDFMNIDERKFGQNYISMSDSFAFQNRLSILEADALVNTNAFIENVIRYITPNICYFPVCFRTITSTNKCIYKKGDKLEVTAGVAQYITDFNGQAFIDGQEVKQENGLFHYSRIITESPGLYKVPIKLILLDSTNNQTEISPGEVKFKVE